MKWCYDQSSDRVPINYQTNLTNNYVLSIPLESSSSAPDRINIGHKLKQGKPFIVSTLNILLTFTLISLTRANDPQHEVV